MAVLAEVEAAVGAIEAAVRDLDPACVSTGDAERLMRAFDRGRRVCTAGRTLSVRRAAEGRTWKDQGHASPAKWIARETGSSVGEAAANGTLKRAARAVPQGAGHRPRRRRARPLWPHPRPPLVPVLDRRGRGPAMDPAPPKGGW